MIKTSQFAKGIQIKKHLEFFFVDCLYNQILKIDEKKKVSCKSKRPSLPN